MPKQIELPSHEGPVNPADVIMAVFNMKRVPISESTDVSKLNKTERQFMNYLTTLNEYEWYGVQCVTLKLADDTRYTPDFIAVKSDAIVAYEVKGFMRDDAAVKLKVAARQYPWMQFILVKKAKHSQWEQTPVKP